MRLTTLATRLSTARIGARSPAVGVSYTPAARARASLTPHAGKSAETLK
jgi:hypothetical protein